MKYFILMAMLLGSTATYAKPTFEEVQKCVADRVDRVCGTEATLACLNTLQNICAELLSRKKGNNNKSLL